MRSHLPSSFAKHIRNERDARFDRVSFFFTICSQDVHEVSTVLFKSCNMSERLENCIRIFCYPSESTVCSILIYNARQLYKVLTWTCLSMLPSSLGVPGVVGCADHLPCDALLESDRYQSSNVHFCLSHQIRTHPLQVSQQTVTGELTYTMH